MVSSHSNAEMVHDAEIQAMKREQSRLCDEARDARMLCEARTRVNLDRGKLESVGIHQHEVEVQEIGIQEDGCLNAQKIDGSTTKGAGVSENKMEVSEMTFGTLLNTVHGMRRTLIV